MSLSLYQRRMQRVRLSESGCWEWMGCLDKCGYGRVLGANNASIPAHRYFYEQEKGPIHAGKEVDHLCRNRRCVNPQHLEAVSHKKNMERGHWASLRHCKHGHEYTPENTYIRTNGNRDCRVCIRQRVKAYTARKSA
jgi:hypothetical protein